LWRHTTEHELWGSPLKNSAIGWGLGNGYF